MNLSARTKYACLAMVELATQYGSNRPVRIREIAQRHEVPARFLVQILLQLKGGGLVASTRGAAGGYHLILPPDEVTLGQVVEIIEGPMPTEENSSGSTPAPTATQVLTEIWQGIAAKEREALHNVSLADLLNRVRNENEQMYYI